MQFHNNTLAIEVSWLINEGIVSKSCYEKLSSRQNLNVVRRGCLNTPALVAYESIPERFRKLIDAKIGGDPYKAVKVNQVESHIKPNQEATDLFENFRLPDGRYLKQDTRREYYANAIVLDAIHRMISDKKAKRSALGSRTTRAWEQICEAVMELDRTKYPHNLPANPRRLEDRYRKYITGGPQSLIHKNFMNKAAAKIKDEVKESFILELVADPRNLNNEQVRALYNQVAERMEWQKITAQTVANWRDKMETTAYAGRRGAVAFSNKKAMQVKRSAPTQPLYYLTIDGWDVELLYQITTTDSKGRTVTTFHNRPTVVVVLDASQKYPLGFAVGTHENPELIKAALRNAMRHTVELFGSMYRAHQIQSDRYAIKQMTPFYETVAEKSTPARAKNAKAKVIEPYFSYLNKTYCQLSLNWSGFGITADRDKQPNIEFLNKYRHDFPDYEGVCKQVAQIIKHERAIKVADYVTRFNALEPANRLELTAAQYLLNFGERTGYTNMLRGTGLRPTINGITRDYDCFDISFREHASTQWHVLYDSEDLTHVLAVNEDQSLRYQLTEKYIQPMALKDRKPGDSEQLELVRNFNKQLESHVIDARANAAELVRATIAANPQLEDTTLRKLLIVDSNGQHKNRLGEAKKALATANSQQPTASSDDNDAENHFDMY
jgi:hypothetical protein